MTLANLISAIGIPGVGGGRASLLASAFGCMNRLMAASIGELMSVPRISYQTAHAIHYWLHLPENVASLRKLEKALGPAGVTLFCPPANEDKNGHVKESNHSNQESR